MNFCSNVSLSAPLLSAWFLTLLHKREQYFLFTYTVNIVFRQTRNLTITREIKKKKYCQVQVKMIYQTQIFKLFLQIIFSDINISRISFSRSLFLSRFCRISCSSSSVNMFLIFQIFLKFLTLQDFCRLKMLFDQQKITSRQQKVEKRSALKAQQEEGCCRLMNQNNPKNLEAFLSPYLVI